MDANQAVELIGTLAVQVGAEHAAYEAAKAHEREAEAAILERVIELVRPALRAVSSAILTREDTTGGANGCNPQAIREYYSSRGLCLESHFSRDRDASGNSGDYSGHALYLLADGTLARATRSGTWSLWQGSWDCDAREIEIVTAAQAMDVYELDTCLEAIHAALLEQVNGGAKAATKAATERAAKLGALLSLI